MKLRDNSATFPDYRLLPSDLITFQKTPPSLFLILAVILSWGGLIPASGQPNASTTTGPIRTVTAALALKRSELSNRYSVDLEAVATFQFGNYFYVQDRTSGIFLQTFQIFDQNVTGKRLRIQGSIIEGEYTNNISLSAYSVLGDGTLPEGNDQTYASLITGDYDAQWVSIEGVIDQITVTNNQAWLTIVMDGGRIDINLVQLLGSGDFATLKRGVLARFEGVSAVKTAKGKITGLYLQSPGFEQVTIIDSQEGTLFTNPITDLGVVASTSNFAANKWVNVTGTYLGSLPSGAFVIKTATTNVLVTTHQNESFRIGDTITVNGVPSRDDLGFYLRAAIAERLGSGTATPSEASYRELSQPGMNRN